MQSVLLAFALSLAWTCWFARGAWSHAARSPVPAGSGLLIGFASLLLADAPRGVWPAAWESSRAMLQAGPAALLLLAALLVIPVLAKRGLDALEDIEGPVAPLAMLMLGVLASIAFEMHDSAMAISCAALAAAVLGAVALGPALPCPRLGPGARAFLAFSMPALAVLLSVRHDEVTLLLPWAVCAHLIVVGLVPRGERASISPPPSPPPPPRPDQERRRERRLAPRAAKVLTLALAAQLPLLLCWRDSFALTVALLPTVAVLWLSCSRSIWLALLAFLGRSARPSPP